MPQDQAVCGPRAAIAPRRIAGAGHQAMDANSVFAPQTSVATRSPGASDKRRPSARRGQLALAGSAITRRSSHGLFEYARTASSLTSTAPATNWRAISSGRCGSARPRRRRRCRRWRHRQGDPPATFRTRSACLCLDSDDLHAGTDCCRTAGNQTAAADRDQQRVEADLLSKFQCDAAGAGKHDRDRRKHRRSSARGLGRSSLRRRAPGMTGPI